MKICGFYSAHDCSFAILEDGIPTVHHELERFSRIKMEISDGLKFVFDVYSDYNTIDYFVHNIINWHGGLDKRYPETMKKARSIGKMHLGSIGHHQAHAANAFFSSNYRNALIITIDGGGEDKNLEGKTITTAFTIWLGKDNKIIPLSIMPIGRFDMGGVWQKHTARTFGLSVGAPGGSQEGTVMAMAAYGDANKYGFEQIKPYNFYIGEIRKNEENKFHIAASIQKFTEIQIQKQIKPYIEKYKPGVVCISGGVAMNSVLTGKFYDWYPYVKKVYVSPTPYDAGCAMGSAQYLWHHILNNSRIHWKDNFSPYMGYSYDKTEILKTLNKHEEIKFTTTNDDIIIDLLNDQKIISVYGGKSETGRRALGNRSILADPRNFEMKNVLNEKVKHRQWFRPFAPSILREAVKDWFERDVDSPYMSIVIKFKENMKDKVPAVVHKDNSARLQTVTKNDNEWYYNFIKKWEKKTGIPIILNTSFNDREPIVETPEHAIKCFLSTEIDYLYFYDYQILVERVIQ
ncbi:MAG: carbamoyltransferase C-terminal domain-containing protein [Promethearchaeota archaeon]|jgi:carbamoyltransferase